MSTAGHRRARTPTRVYVVEPARFLLCSVCDDGSFNEVVLPCGHTTCRACVTAWFAAADGAVPKQAKSCPSGCATAFACSPRWRPT